MSSPVLDEIQARLGYRRTNLLWAKAEIALGLFAAGLGLFVGLPAAGRPVEGAWPLVAAGLALFVLGCLTLAGHRSHLYQAGLERLALVVGEMRKGGNAPLSLPSSGGYTRATGGDMV